MKFYQMINVKFDHDLVYTTHFVAAENIISYLFQEQSTYYIQVPVFYLNFICIFKYGMCNYFFDEFLNWAHMKSITYPTQRQLKPKVIICIWNTCVVKCKKIIRIFCTLHTVDVWLYLWQLHIKNGIIEILIHWFKWMKYISLYGEIIDKAQLMKLNLKKKRICLIYRFIKCKKLSVYFKKKE